ncbi:MAG: PrsW family glutamic-type intramembrane protease [Candidatus Parcubacteria bacterium]|nr:PrsW family glutamic-type intramembrane protease [Candidatus Parcubacteria bacterium]
MATHHHINIKKTGSVALFAFILTWIAMKFPEDSSRTIGALLGGILPALFWLWFWLKEDKVHPEPKKIIFEAFLFGMLAVPLAILFEKITFWSGGTILFSTFFIWAVIEETFKYYAAFIAGIRTQYFDEPIDVIMYMISAALGFSAAENALFVFTALDGGALAVGITTLQLRFIGASLLHVASSALIGFSIGFGLGESRWKKYFYLFTGLILAFALHTAFNYFIMIGGGQSLLGVFALLWVVIVVIIALFEKIKKSSFYFAPPQ